MPKHPSKQDIKVAADAAVFTVAEGELRVLLVEMKKRPYAGRRALPGGLLARGETSEETVRRVLREQTGVRDCHLEQLMTFDDPARDPFGRVVSVAHIALMPSEGVRLRTTGKYAGVAWVPVSKAKRLAYDHDAVLGVAAERLRSKLEYTNVAWSLLPRAFPLSKLKAVYEVILGRALDKRNFRKRILELGIVVPTGKREEGVAYRPAELYRFKVRKTKVVDRL